MPDYRSRNASPKLSLARKTATLFLPVCPAPFGATRRIAGCIAQRMAAKTGKLALKGSNLSTGCSAVAIDPNDSNVMFAALWDFRRKGWTFRSGGDGPNAPSGSGLFRSSDGGILGTRSPQRTARVFQRNPMAECDRDRTIEFEAGLRFC